MRGRSSESAPVSDMMENQSRLGVVRKVRLRLATHFALARAKRQSGHRARRLPFQHVLVLCYGNIYRSPFVAAYIARELQAAGCSSVRSAGFHPRADRPTPDDFVALARARAGIELGRHRSSLVSPEDFAWADVVLLMDRHNWHAVASSMAGAEALSRVIWLGALGGSGAVEITDPYGASSEVKAAIIDQLIESADEFCRIIRARTAAGSDGRGNSV